MPSPLAHIGVALATRVALGGGARGSLRGDPGGAARLDRLAVACAVASVLPDVDMLLVVALPGGIALHHGPTHSLVVAALGGVAVAWSLRLRGPRALAIAALCGAQHVILDAFTGDPADAARFGVPWAWPFADHRYIAPISLFIPFGIDREGFLWHMVSAEALRAYAREVGVVVFAAGLAVAARVAVGRVRAARLSARP